MKHIFNACIFTILAFVGHLSSSFASESEAIDTGKVVAQLVSSHDRAAPGQTIEVALRTILDDHWHTYWRNPGDSGEPVQITWSLPNGVEAGEIVWPLPQAIATGPIVNYGFEGKPLFPVPITLPDTAVIGETLLIEAEAYYLVCKDICIPESADLSLQIDIGEPIIDERWSNLIILAKRRAPKEGNVSGKIGPNSNGIGIEFSNLPKGDFSQAFFFPYKQGVVLPASPQDVSFSGERLSLSSVGDFLWDGEVPDTLQGVLSYSKDGRAIGEVVTLDVVSGTSAQPKSGSLPTSSFTLLTALFGAFLGGLILNLMPCVFPVISIKALSLAKVAHQNKVVVRREGWFYTFGVVATFGVLTAALLILKAAGTDLGWGFQLQSPIVVGLLALLLFTLGLNLLGFFELSGGLQNIGGDLATHQGGKGAFFTGALAVIVATPCTAPFMAGAIGFALAQSAFVTIVVFLGLAVGFALPFLALSYSPSLLRMLPKPGPWMVRFKEFLAFPMLLAAVWLVWVLTVQSGQSGLIKILLAMVAIGFAIWVTRSGKALSKVFAAAAILFSLIAPFSLSTTANIDNVTSVETAEAWSLERIQALRVEGKNVFVDFTAAWCVTCKVNERLVLNTEETRALFSRTNTVKMIADWTNKNDEIAEELARHGRSGVPLYLVYRADNNDVSPKVLPQILTQSVLESALEGD